MHAQACSLDVQFQPGIARREEYFPISNMPFYPPNVFSALSSRRLEILNPAHDDWTERNVDPHHLLK
jgi:hypothetical protein